MLAFYILKPDMLKDANSLNYFFDNLKEIKEVKLIDLYYIKDWVSLSKLLYEIDSSALSSKDIIKKRKQLITTIRGYHEFYQKEPGLLSLLEVSPRNKTLRTLHALKKELRQKYVYNTKKHYLRFLNESQLNFEKKLIDFDIDNIPIQFKVLNGHETMDHPQYHLAYFNKIHFPDPHIASINRDFKALEKKGLLKKSNKVFLKGVKR